MAPYFLRNLVPKKEKVEQQRPLWEVLKGLSWTQWGLFFSGWLAWTCDAMDFYSVSLTVVILKEQFHRSIQDVTTSITLTLLLRPVGAVIFGLISDRFGRRWPLVANLLIISVMSLCTGFVQTFQQFLAVRSIFGLGMGGIWGLASASALENIPVEARGLASGVIQQGYAVGCIVAAVIYLGLVPRTSWRALFWTTSGLSLFAAVLRAILPESEVFLRAQREEFDRSAQSKTRVFFHEVVQMLKNHWLRCFYFIVWMTGFSFLSHSSQDLYPTYLQVNKGFTHSDAAVATIIGNCGAVAGGAIAGTLSQYIGRRLTMIIFLLLLGAFIPLWIIPDTFNKLSAGAFCTQFGVHGSLGVVPILLSEISPPAFRATFAGVAYQTGSMASSASAQIEATAGEYSFTTIMTPKGPEQVPNYARIQGIFVGCVAAFLFVLTILGPENHGSHFERGKTAFQIGASKEDIGFIPAAETEEVRDAGRSSTGDEEKIDA